MVPTRKLASGSSRKDTSLCTIPGGPEVVVALGTDDEEVEKTGSHSLAVLVSVSVVINLTKSNLGEEWVYLTYRLQSVIKGSKGRNSRQKKKPGAQN